MLDISPKEKDIIKVIIQSGIAKAASSFALISKDEVAINVPELDIVNPSLLVKQIDPAGEVKIIIQSEIKGDINGQTLLFFYENQLELLERVCLNFTHAKTKVKTLKESLVQEISNIITGKLVTELASILKLNIFGSVPKAPVYPNQAPEKTATHLDLSNSLLVTIKTSFVKSGKLISLPFVIIFDILNMAKILNIIRDPNFQQAQYPKPGAGAIDANPSDNEGNIIR